MYDGTKRINEDRMLISEALSEIGYQTAGFHSNLFLSAEFGYSRGFDTFYDSKEDPTVLARFRDWVRRTLDQDGALYGFLKWAFDRTEEHAGVELGSLYTTADDLTDRAVEWLRGTDKEPVFCWVHYMDVHHPYVPPVEHQQAFRDEPIGNHRAIQLRRKMLEDPAAITERELSDLMDLYDAEIKFTDTEIQRLIGAAQAELENPVVIVTSEHGEEFRQHGQFSHGTVHDEGIHVPLIVHDDEGDGRYEDLVGLIDLGPTITDYAERSSPETFYGHSLHPLLEGESFSRSHVIGEWGEYPDRYNRFYRDTEWKYINDEDGHRLYHLPEDAEEQENTVGQFPDVVKEIQTELNGHEEQVATTQTDTDSVEMTEEVTERLEQLGYKME